MLTLLRNGHVFDPEDRGQCDLLLAGGKIIAMGESLPSIPDGLGPVEEVDLSGKRVVPGFIDSHVHFTGGGGNEGYGSRIPDAHLSDITSAGITTAVSCLGVDHPGKSLDAMLLKARALDEEGLTTYIYVGSFTFGRPTFFGDLREDIPLIDKVLGIKIAVSESRGSHPSPDDLAELASDAYTGGLLAGKPGCLNIHLGLKNEDPYPLLREGLDRSGVPPEQFTATHVNYSGDLLKGALKFADAGTYLNVDSILTPRRWVMQAVEPHLAIIEMLEAGIPVERIGMSTDGNASVPRRPPQGGERGPYRLGFDTLIYELKALHERGIDLTTTLRTVTTTPAKILGLQDHKGELKPGMDADIVALDDAFSVQDVWCRGKQHIRDGDAIVLGMFEIRETPA